MLAYADVSCKVKKRRVPLYIQLYVSYYCIGVPNIMIDNDMYIIYVCVYVYIYLYIYIYVYIFIYYVAVNICIYISMYIYKLCVCEYANIYEWKRLLVIATDLS
jgi:hypothetical protein